MAEKKSTYDTDQPWVVYHFGLTHDGFWPPWTSTRVLGVAKIVCECAVCGKRCTVKCRIPRFGNPNPSGRHHPERLRFLLDHLHKDRPAPMAWARPLLNPAAHRDGVDLEQLAMRLEADLAAGEEEAKHG